jgi:hypothetical protein
LKYTRTKKLRDKGTKRRKCVKKERTRKRKQKPRNHRILLLLTVEQKETCHAVARDLLQCAGQDANYMKNLITGDESWVYGYDPETKAQ